MYIKYSICFTYIFKTLKTREIHKKKGMGVWLVWIIIAALILIFSIVRVLIKKDHSKYATILLFVIVGGIVIFSFLSPIVFTTGNFIDWFNSGERLWSGLFRLNLDVDFTETGNIGDTFGGITAPIIGIVNVILLFVTLNRQIKFEENQDKFNKNQLLSQREEQFKSTFFQMLQTQRELLNGLRGRFLYRHIIQRENDTNIVSGIDYFAVARVELKDIFENLEIADEENVNTNLIPKENWYIRKEYKDADNEEKMKLAYDYFFSRHIEVGSYFRHLYHILKMIDEEEKAIENISEKSEKEVFNNYKNYADILQATLSNDELLLAYYNCASFPNAKELFLKFRFTENLFKKSLIDENRDKMKQFEFREI